MKQFLLVVIMALVSFTRPQTKNYKQVFGADYTRAVKWLQQNNAIIEKYAIQCNIPAKALKSIVFPELIRYNSVYDVIEINSLKYLYVSEGKAYADFSVGYFQMKPSFAEMVEQDAGQLNDSAFLGLSGFDSLIKATDNETTRKARIQRITSISQQVIYLCAFYKICSAQFAGVTFASISDKIKFYATCYNAGYRRSYQEINALSQKNFFHTGKLLTSTGYNYADISNYYFEQE